MFAHVFPTLFSMILGISSVWAAAPSQADYSQINLTNFRLLDADNQDAFGYQVVLTKNPSRELIRHLESETYAKAVSPIFEFDGKNSRFYAIYVFIGLDEDNVHQLYMVYVNKPGTWSVVDMKIVDVTRNKMTLVNGPSDELETYTLIPGSGSLFP